jgi:hypothetical protein
MQNRRGAKQYSCKAWRPQAKKHPPIAPILRHHQGIDILPLERLTPSVAEHLRTPLRRIFAGQI